MSQFVLVIYLLIITLQILFWFRLFNQKGMTGIVSLSFPFFFGMGWFIYTFFFILEKILKGNFSTIDYLFTSDTIIALFSLIVGSIFSQLLFKSLPKKKSHYFPKQKEVGIRLVTLIIFSIINLLILNLYIELVFNGWNTYFNQTYGLFNNENINSFTSTIPLFIVSYIFVFNSSIFKLTKIQEFIVVTLSLIFIIIFFLGGNRNISMMMLISFVFAKFYEKKINVFYIIPIVVIGIIVGGLNAIGRNYGLINFLTFNVDIDYQEALNFILSVSNGEFGTMARIYSYYNEFNFDYNHFPGYSFFVNPIINLIPSYIFNERPLTIAAEFTKQYWGNIEYGTIGLGFSPLIEAKINFGKFWFIIFIFWGSLYGIFEKIVFNKFEYKYLITGSLSIVVLNFFRIDFAIFFKFFVLVLAISYIILKFLKK